MIRHPDWRHCLEAFIQSRHQAAFSWAQNNGAVFSAGAVEAMTGESLYPAELLTVAEPADVQAEIEARDTLRSLELQALRARRELKGLKAKQEAHKRGFSLRFWTSQEERELQAEIEALETRIQDVGANLLQQQAAVAAAAKRVATPILAAVEAEGGIAAMVTARLGNPLPGILHASMGDVVMATISDGQPCLGICLGAHCVFVSEEGLSKIRLGHCMAAWHIPAPEFEHLHANVLKGSRRGS